MLARARWERFEVTVELELTLCLHTLRETRRA
jgi:hypothetical protein